MEEAIELFGRASWIWPNHRLYDLYNVFARFRKDFTIPSVPPSATLHITADQGYRLWVNGRYVTRGPARGYQESWPYDTVDIAEYLVEGDNRIAAEVYNPGHSTYSYLSQNSAGFICAARIGECLLVSDGSWHCSYEDARARDTALFSRQLFHQEHIDGRKYDREWIRSPLPPAGWKAPETTVFGAMPWHGLEERGTPQLRERSRRPQAMVSATSAPTREDYRAWRNVTEGLSAALKDATWIKAADGGRIRDREPGSYTLPAAGAGRLQALILDMGQTVVGPASLEISGGAAGEVVDLFYFEVLKELTEPTIPFPAFCEASMSNRLILKEGETSCEFFHLLGFRFILAAIHESVREVSLEIEISDTGYPYRDIGKFECSDPLLNGIWNTCRRTEEVCSLDSYVDTPWREQTQWWGDCNVQFRNSLTMDWDPRLMKRGLESVIRQRVPNGLTYGHAPTMAHQCILPDYSLSWIIFLYDYYSRTGDLSVFTKYLDRIDEIFAYFEGEAPKREGLLAFDRRYWLFLDWSSLEKDGAPTLFSMWYLYALRLAARLFRAAGLSEGALALDAKAESIKASIERLTFDEAAGLFHDGYDADGGRLGTHSVHVQALAILLGLRPEGHPKMLEERIVPYLKGLPLGVPLPSAYWSTFVLSAARENGLRSLALDFIRRRWAPMVEHGTTFEVFGPEEEIVAGEHFESINANWGNFSASHAWTAHPMFHLTEILGGVTNEPEDQVTVNYAPWFEEGISDVKVEVPHPLGLVSSHWERKGNSIYVRLSLPEGAKARVALPGFAGIVEGERSWIVDERRTS
jgi:alpha-L-rhamnosidase